MAATHQYACKQTTSHQSAHQPTNRSPFCQHSLLCRSHTHTTQPPPCPAAPTTAAVLVPWAGQGGPNHCKHSCCAVVLLLLLLLLHSTCSRTAAPPRLGCSLRARLSCAAAARRHPQRVNCPMRPPVHAALTPRAPDPSGQLLSWQAPPPPALLLLLPLLGMLRLRGWLGPLGRASLPGTWAPGPPGAKKQGQYRRQRHTIRRRDDEQGWNSAGEGEKGKDSQRWQCKQTCRPS
jgi:hypothetical protein